MQICNVCKKPITMADEMAEDVRQIDGKNVHADCYYENLGQVVEEHPIVTPGGRRG